MIQSLKGEPTLKGYRCKVVVDQFPLTDKAVDVLGVQSSHVETVCLLSRESGRRPDNYVKIGVDVEDYYKIKNE